MRIPSPRARRRARIEIIPLIDIMFFLLATFLMVSLSMIKNQGISVHLPAAATGTPQDRNDSVTISIDQSGSYFWNKSPVDLPEIVTRLHELKISQDDPKIFIHGDGQTYFENVVTLLDETRKAGITKVAIETAKPPSQ